MPVRQRPTTAKARVERPWAAILVRSIAGYALLSSVILPFLGARAAIGASVSAAFLFAVVDGVRRYGVRHLAVLFAAAVLIGNLLEGISTRTGVPFGSYHHNTGPKILDVPITVGPTYFAVGYVVWRVAGVLMDAGDGRVGARPWDTLLVPAAAAVLGVMYDLTIDPVGSTVDHFWTWEGGGAYFGVPFANFLGWLITLYAFLQIFAVVVRSPAEPPRTVLTGTAQDRLPVVVYLAMGVTPVFSWLNSLRSPDRPVLDATGHMWHVRAVYASTTLVSLFTICAISLSALLLINRRRHHSLTPQQEATTRLGSL